MRMDEVALHREPPTTVPTLVTACSGWIDAGEAATDALRFLVRQLAAEPLATMDLEDCVDFTQDRPVVRLHAEGERTRRWPRSAFWLWQPPEPRAGLLLFRGLEPQRRWRTSATLLLDVAARCGVQRIVSLGAMLADNWLRVVDAAERPQIDQGIGHPLHPIVSRLDAFKSEQSPLARVLPRKGPLNAQASRMDGGVDEPVAPPLGALAVARRLWAVRDHPRVENALPRRSGVKTAIELALSPSEGHPTSWATCFRAFKLLGNKTMADSWTGATGRGASP
jgi:hypothetical protein